MAWPQRQHMSSKATDQDSYRILFKSMHPKDTTPVKSCEHNSLFQKSEIGERSSSDHTDIFATDTKNQPKSPITQAQQVHEGNTGQGTPTNALGALKTLFEHKNRLNDKNSPQSNRHIFDGSKGEPVGVTTVTTMTGPTPALCRTKPVPEHRRQPFPLQPITNTS
jgi:hypothetical protein